MKRIFQEEIAVGKTLTGCDFQKIPKMYAPLPRVLLPFFSNLSPSTPSETCTKCTKKFVKLCAKFHLAIRFNVWYNCIIGAGHTTPQFKERKRFSKMGAILGFILFIVCTTVPCLAIGKWLREEQEKKEREAK